MIYVQLVPQGKHHMLPQWDSIKMWCGRKYKSTSHTTPKHLSQVCELCYQRYVEWTDDFETYGTNKGTSMIEPTPKSSQIDSLLTALTGKSRHEMIQDHKCMTCNRPTEQFRDTLSLKEYAISGMCQVCQDEVFPPDYTDDEPINL